MNSRLLMTLQVTVVGPPKISAVPHGTGVTAPIASGTFDGPRLRGKVLPASGDWTLLRGELYELIGVRSRVGNSVSSMSPRLGRTPVHSRGQQVGHQATSCQTVTTNSRAPSTS